MLTLSDELASYLFQKLTFLHNNMGSNFTNSFETIACLIFIYKVKFLLYTRANPTNAQVVTTDPASIKGSNFVATKQTKFIIHGHTDAAYKASNVAIRDAFLKKVFSLRFRFYSMPSSCCCNMRGISKL